MLDPIAEMLTRIRNAQRAGHPSVALPASRMKLAIAEILKAEGFVESVEVIEEGIRKTLVIGLKYRQVSLTKREPAIQEIERISKEGRRVYVKQNEVVKVKNGYGISIISTSQGLMTGLAAHKRRLGGEYICQAW
ncbi:MAG: 30S ribosomal protein S8 [Candidatus Moraniibacteriota bacterium]|nr:MAG: 30S ribosomal protein S8 [Candidatus Moranbacteria bacterium]